MCSTRTNRTVGVNKSSQLHALATTVAVLLALSTAQFSESVVMRLAMFSLAAAVVAVLLFRIYCKTQDTEHADKLLPARIHILLHVAPLVFFITLLFSIRTPAMNLALVLLFFLFFGSGRLTWSALGKLYPSTLLYQIFFRANSAFLWSFPVIYLTSLLKPELVTFVFIRNVALFYFTVHLTIVGGCSLKIEADLNSTSAPA